MRIIIDLQACQSQSAQRGIGRYSMSLVSALLQLNQHHDIFIVLSGAFPLTIEPLKQHFSQHLPEDNILVWHAPLPLNPQQKYIPERAEVAALLREAFIKQLQPDVVLLTSLFEGFADNAITSIGALDTNTPTAVILYDLIPMLYPEIYLTQEAPRLFYEKKISTLKQAHLLLSISNSAKQEALTHLDAQIPIDVISSAAESHFKKINYDAEQIEKIRTHFRLKKPFLMYTGGIDPRKNIEGLIEAFSKLAPTLLDAYQLAIVCHIRPIDKLKLTNLIQQLGLTEEHVVITGFVTEEELIALYNLCHAFIFPSIHEGFGLPILEAMQCGAPVIGSDRSSIPEALGYKEALFDPTDCHAITQKITHVLTDETFRQTLITHAKQQVKLFSWEQTAAHTLRALEKLHEEKQPLPPLKNPSTKLKLAFVSPLPPEQTGIAQYCRMLLPALYDYYDIDVIVTHTEVEDAWIKQHCKIQTIERFLTHGNEYDRVLYHFGNSTFHTHQFQCINAIPGVVVLHDFYLSGILSHLEMTEKKPVWSQELYRAHGYHALFERHHLPDIGFVRKHYPCNASVIQASIGLIVHADESIRLAKQWLHEPCEKRWFKIPHLKSINPASKEKARQHLNFPANAFITTSFGFLATTKKSLEILKAWHHSSLSENPHHYLIFVGEADSHYNHEIQTYLTQHHLKERVIITGWTDDDLFNIYLKAADLAIQLRTDSRGETSGAVLGCLASGTPTLVNAHGSMQDIPDNVVFKLEDKFTQEDLVKAIEKLANEHELRDALSMNAITHIKEQHDQKACAKAYFDAIETSYASMNHPQILLQKIRANHTFNQSDLLLLLENLVTNQPPRAIKQLFIDITAWMKNSPSPFYQHTLRQFIHHPPKDYRIEPIYKNTHEPYYRYARTWTMRSLGLPKDQLCDDIISARMQDVYLSFSTPTPKQQLILNALKRRGVKTLIQTAAHHQITLQPEPLISYLKHCLPHVAWHTQLTNSEAFVE